MSSTLKGKFKFTISHLKILGSYFFLIMQIFTSSTSTVWIVKVEIVQTILYRLAFKHVLKLEQAYGNSVLVKATLLYLFKHLFTHNILIHSGVVNTRGRLLICAFGCKKWHQYMIQLGCCKMCSYTEMPYHLSKYFSVWEECATQRNIIMPSLSYSALQQDLLESGCFQLSCLSWKL